MPLSLPLLPDDPGAPFPPPETALDEPNGLLAAGGDLSPARLLNAYRNGIFPWYSQGQPILWWCPDPRMVFATDDLRLSSRLRRFLRGSGWVLRADTAFGPVIDACAHIRRPGQRGTWITDEMRRAYVELHGLGHAHSIEAYAGEELVGGIYGVAVGRMFYGESMFSARPGGSKAALAGLACWLRGWGWPLIDAQVDNPHLRSLGARPMPRTDFLRTARMLAASPGRPGPWTSACGEMPASRLAPPPT